MVHDTMNRFFARLPEESFMCIHKSYVINLEHIAYIEGNQVRIGEHSIPASPSQRDELLSRFSP